MKTLLKYYFTFLLLCVYSYSNGQKLVNENFIWSVSEQPSEEGTYFTKHTTFKGDTTIEGKNYFKVLESTTINPYDWTFQNQCIREENNKIFLLNTNNSSEELLYDFSVSVGDSIYNEYQDDYCYVDSIVPTSFGEETLNVFHLSSHEYIDFRWIEKLGSDFGVLKPYGAFLVGAYFDLLCVNKETELFYQNPNFGVCHRDNSTTVEDFTESPLLQLNSISPGTLTIDTFNHKGKLNLYTIGGQFIQKADIEGIQETICLPISGVIIYQFITENNKKQTGKILIK